VDFNYDTGGRLQSLVLPEGTQTFAYQPTSGQLTTVTHTDGSTLNYTYDGALLRAETWSGNLRGSIQQDYNNDLRLANLKVNGANPITYSYDAEGWLTGAGELTLTRQIANGLLMGTTLKQVTTQLTHNPFGELASETVKFGENLLYQATYSRDKLGRILTKVETVAGETHTAEYRYDTRGRLVEVKQDGLVTQTFSYDGNGNRLTTNQVTARYDHQDRLLQVGDVTYSYTVTGNLQTQNGQTTHYTYDTLGNLTKVELPNGTVVEYLIDGNDRRVGRTVNGNITHQWLYQGPLTPIAQVDNQGQVIARYVYGSQDQVPDYLLMGEAIYRLVTDHLGSVRLVVNVMTGEVVQRLDYDVWGNVLSDTNPGFQPFGFAGGFYDSLTGLVHFGSREYDPQVGRWTTTDPIGFASEDTNLYAYVYNDPVNSVDPSGLFLNLIAGCLISGGIELASQMLLERKSLECVDWGGVLMEAATGCNPFTKWKKLSKVVEGAQCVLGNSLVAGMLVHTDQGLKPIEEIKLGEKVLSRNERSGQTSYEPVLELMQHEGTFQLVKVTLDSGESLEATAGHPFYVPGKGWNVAANLKVGDVLQLHNGITLVIKTVETSTREGRVYNFAVAQNANYFVGEVSYII
jgi:RHS repeat-associated protein